MARGTNRRKVVDDTVNLINPIGTSPTNDIITEKQQDVAGTTPTFKRGRTTLRREDVTPDFRERFKSSRQFFEQEDVTKPASELGITQDVTDIVKVQPAGKAPKGRGRGVVRRTATPFSALEKGGQTEIEQERLGALSKLEAGTQISPNFSIAGKPIAEEGRLGPGGALFGGTRRGGKQPSIFSAKGMERFFGNLGDLANKIASPQFQKQVRDERIAASTKAGKRADIKAKTDRMKAFGSLIKDLSESGGNESLIKTLEEKIQSEVTADVVDPKAQLANQLAELGLPREMIVQIFGTIDKGVTR